MKRAHALKVFSLSRWLSSFYSSEMMIIRQWRQGALDMMDFTSGGHILLPGAGSGYELVILAENVIVQRYITGYERFDCPDNTIDKAILSLFLTRVSEPQAVFSEVVRVVRPGGEILVYDYILRENKEIIEDALLNQTAVLVDMTPKDPFGLEGLLLLNATC